ncbi:DUF6444 domain-containing protein, partial [Streptomyces sp. NPDC057910]|uniref:DUF6444 domain-containing protein n=1 Tax=Streptomyces sp. NPDC057910 TaxID=3346278 RepID=UPI0036E708C4
MSLPPSYEELAALVAVQARVIDELRAEVAALRAENAKLKRRLDGASTNSSQPSSKDSIAAKAKKRANLSSRERSKDRRPGGQPGRKGVRLEPAEKPDRTERVAGTAARVPRQAFEPGAVHSMRCPGHAGEHSAPGFEPAGPPH